MLYPPGGLLKEYWLPGEPAFGPAEPGIVSLETPLFTPAADDAGTFSSSPAGVRRGSGLPQLIHFSASRSLTAPQLGQNMV
jgi:hypothetical protein